MMPAPRTCIASCCADCSAAYNAELTSLPSTGSSVIAASSRIDRAIMSNVALQSSVISRAPRWLSGSTTLASHTERTVRIASPYLAAIGGPVIGSSNAIGGARMMKPAARRSSSSCGASPTSPSSSVSRSRRIAALIDRVISRPSRNFARAMTSFFILAPHSPCALNSVSGRGEAMVRRDNFLTGNPL